MVGTGRCQLGPIADMRSASVICVPLANFDTEEPEGGQHWTLLVLQRAPAPTPASESAFDGDRRRHHSPAAMHWYPPLHIDSALRANGNGEATSSNAVFAQRAAHVVMSGLAADASEACGRAVTSCVRVVAAGGAAGGSNGVALCSASPQQQNGHDCGIFAALAARDALRLFCDEGRGDGWLGERRDGTAASAWTFDQSVATDLRRRVYSEMVAAMNAQNDPPPSA